ncbi:heavy metal-binding protein HIP-like isoform X1 [Mercenaria mercenaria]|uniref:heavy metal-binding protein HIP-like isoform X1 n=1 Tax=Mercenaria mercenaria TaxID=6596 RepID=UPI00234EC42A|nr:heavy metal-binding protein HIP-like isoform X1 [Mercenaria mercenaria]
MLKKLTFSLFVIYITLYNTCFGIRNDEPRCLSHFDYDYKVLNKLVSLEHEVRSLTETVNKQESVINMIRSEMTAAEPHPQVAFMAELTTSLTGKINRIYFDHVKLNLGKAYRPHHGLFIAPANGTYQFSVAACSRSGHFIVLEMKVNDDVVGKMLAGDNGYDSCNSKVFLTELKVGDDVLVEHGDHGDYLLANEAYGYPSFTGILLQAT